MNSDPLLALYDRAVDTAEGVTRLRRLILDLAIQGRLVHQDSQDEIATELIRKILSENRDLRLGREILEMSEEGNSERSLLKPPPPGWTTTSLAAISRRIHYGYTASADASLRDVRLLRISDIQKDGVNWDTVPGCVIQNKEVAQYKLEKGDILIARTGGTIGKSFLVRDVPVTSVFASYLIRVQGTPHVLGEYLELFLDSSLYWNQLRAGARGTGQPNVNGQTLGQLALLLPPLAEQRRIVAKADELMVLCDQFEKARAERETRRDKLTAATHARLRTPDPKTFRNDVRFALENLQALTTRSEQIGHLRMSILNLAVRGRLSEQSARDEPASKLLARILAAKGALGLPCAETDQRDESMPFDLPVGWVWTRIGEIASKTGSGSTPRGGKSAYKSAGVPFLRSQNVHNDGLRLTDVAFIDRQTHEKMAATAVAPRDLLLNITGGSMGRCCHVPEEFGEANVSQHVAIIRCAIPEVSDFLHKLTLSPYFQAFIFEGQTGAGRGGLPKNRMDRIAVALPPLAEQKRIVTKIDTLMSICDQLEVALTVGDKTRSRLLDALLSESMTSSFEQGQLRGEKAQAHPANQQRRRAS